MPCHPDRLAPLAPEGAFVVQFRTDPTWAAQPLAGRVEHIVSGQARRFESGTELLAFMEEVLRGQRQRGGQRGSSGSMSAEAAPEADT